VLSMTPLLLRVLSSGVVVNSLLPSLPFSNSNARLVSLLGICFVVSARSF
jgi:hypothetical protein